MVGQPWEVNNGATGGEMKIKQTLGPFKDNNLDK